MNPHKMNKVDVSDQKAFKLYGKLPSKNVLTKMQKDRKYFDSGDYMMNKAGVQSAQAPGTAIPTPEGLPHAFSPPASTSPIAAGMSSSPGASLLSQTAPGGGGGSGPGSAPAPAGSPVNIPGRASLSPTNSQGSISSSGPAGGSAPMAVPSGHAHAQPTFAPSFGGAGVGVGISPAASNDGMDMPMGGHRRRPSESFNRTSPPAALREGPMPSSSYPIQHQAFGSSPVKTSMLARRAVEENE